MIEVSPPPAFPGFPGGGRADPARVASTESTQKSLAPDLETGVEALHHQPQLCGLSFGPQVRPDARGWQQEVESLRGDGGGSMNRIRAWKCDPGDKGLKSGFSTLSEAIPLLVQLHGRRWVAGCKSHGKCRLKTGFPA